VKNIGKRTTGIGWGLEYPAVQAVEYAINRPKVKRQAAAEGAAALARNPFLMYYLNPKYKKSSIGGTMTKEAQVQKVMEKAARIDRIRKAAAFGWLRRILPSAGRQAATTAGGFSAPLVVGNLPGAGANRVVGREVMTATAGGALIAALERLISGRGGAGSKSHKSAWKKLVARYPEFDDDAHRELFEAIHAFSPTVAAVPSTVAPILRSATDYGAEGIDISTARTLSSIEGSPNRGYLEANLTPKFIYDAMRDAAKTSSLHSAEHLAKRAGTVI
jgi:hypothetical protein